MKQVSWQQTVSLQATNLLRRVPTINLSSFHTWHNLNPVETKFNIGFQYFSFNIFKTHSEYDINLLIALYNYAKATPAVTLKIFVCVQRIILNFDCPLLQSNADFADILITVDPGALELVPRLLQKWVEFLVHFDTSRFGPNICTP